MNWHTRESTTIPSGFGGWLNSCVQITARRSCGSNSIGGCCGKTPPFLHDDAHGRSWLGPEPVRTISSPRIESWPFCEALGCQSSRSSDQADCPLTGETGEAEDREQGDEGS